MEYRRLGRLGHESSLPEEDEMPRGNVAGIGRMNYTKFMFYSFSGSIFWIGFFVYGGYYFGNIPVVRNNLTLFILGIIVISIMPGIVEFVRQRTRKA